jgi:hypothetical protein
MCCAASRIGTYVRRLGGMLVGTLTGDPALVEDFTPSPRPASGEGGSPFEPGPGGLRMVRSNGTSVRLRWARRSTADQPRRPKPWCVAERP